MPKPERPPHMLKPLLDPALDRYAFAHTRREPDLLRELEEETHASMPASEMLTGRVEGRLLKLLVLLSGARRVLEIGTYTGYSALSMAEALPEDGRLHTCEMDPRHRDFAQAFFDRSPHGRKIEILFGPASETLSRVPGPIDFAFIDADKEGYPAYYERTLELLRPGGLMLLDNMLREGRVLNPEDPGTVAIDGLNRKIAADPRVENVLLTVRDGVQLVRKRD